MYAEQARERGFKLASRAWVAEAACVGDSARLPARPVYRPLQMVHFPLTVFLREMTRRASMTA